MATKDTIGGIVLAGMLVLGGLAMCSKDDQAPQRAVSAKGPDAAVADDLREVHGVTALDTSKLRAEGIIATVIKGDSLFAGGHAAKDVLESVQKLGPALPYKKVVVRLDENLVDRYGQESVEPLFNLTYDRSDIDKMNFKNLLGWDILNFAEVEALSPVARHIAAQECEPDSDNAKYANAFCAVAVGAR